MQPLPKAKNKAKQTQFRPAADEIGPAFVRLCKYGLNRPGFYLPRRRTPAISLYLPRRRSVARPRTSVGLVGSKLER